MISYGWVLIVIVGFISCQVYAKQLFQLDLGRLWLERVGEGPNAYMRTTNVLTPVLAPKSSFLIKNGTVSPSSALAGLPIITAGVTPPRASFNGEWRGQNIGESDASILGVFS